MAYVPGFKHDVFISYAHRDNISVPEEQEKWVDKFLRLLEEKLQWGLQGRKKPEIWKDTRVIRGNTIFQSEIHDALSECAVIVFLLSPRYLNSPYCLDELNHFCATAKAADGLVVKNQVRVFKVRLNDVSRTWKQLKGIPKSNYDFFYEDKDKRKRLLVGNRTDPDGNQYHNKLHDLTDDIAQLLYQMRRLKRSPVNSAARKAKTDDEKPPEGPAVYLADVADDMDEEYSEIRQALKDLNKGIRVLPEQRLILDDPELEKNIQRQIEQSAITIHLIGKYPGEKLTNEARSIVHLQYTLAAEIAQKQPGLHRIVIQPPDLIPDLVRNQIHRNFLAALKKDFDSPLPPERFEEGVQKLKEYLQDKLFKAPPVSIPRPDAADIAPLVYISYLPEDVKYAQAIDKCLSGRYDLALSPLDKRFWQKDHKNNMDMCDALLLLYGDAPRDCIREIANDARKLVESRSIVASIYDGPPEEKEDLGIRFRNWTLLNCRNGFSCDLLEPFINALKGQKQG